MAARCKVFLLRRDYFFAGGSDAAPRGVTGSAPSAIAWPRFAAGAAATSDRSSLAAPFDLDQRLLARRS